MRKAWKIIFVNGKTMQNHHAIDGKNHNFDWAMASIAMQEITRGYIRVDH